MTLDATDLRGVKEMADERGNAFDPDKIAALLDKAAEDFTPEVKTIKAKLSHPVILEKVGKMKQRGASPAYIVKALEEAGIKMSAGTFVKYWPEVSGEQKDASDAKPGRKSQKTNPRTASGTSEGRTTDKPKATEAKPAGTRSGSVKGSESGTTAGTDTGTATGTIPASKPETKTTSHGAFRKA